MMMRSQVDVLLLDLESRSPSLGEDLAFVDAVKHHHVPLVAMTADGTRATALEFLQQGVEFVRKPRNVQISGSPFETGSPPVIRFPRVR
jgi:DNA-binding NtrC family response regulator